MADFFAAKLNKYNIDKESVKRLIKDIKDVSKESGLTISEVTDIWKVAVLDRANNINIEQCDFLNNHNSDVSKLLDKINETLNGISNVLED